MVLMYFSVFGRCLMNDHHGLQETDGRIFYTDRLERMGFRPNRPLLKRFVRRYLYFLLAAFTLLWQLVFQMTAVVTL